MPFGTEQRARGGGGDFLGGDFLNRGGGGKEGKSTSIGKSCAREGEGEREGREKRKVSYLALVLRHIDPRLIPFSKMFKKGLLEVEGGGRGRFVVVCGRKSWVVKGRR